MTAPATTADGLTTVLRRLADRSKLRSEATIQADVRQLLLSAGLNLEEHELDVQLETQVGDRRRIDVEVGFTVIEVKKDLRSESVAAAARTQLTGYVSARESQTGQRYLGVLTDGALWRAYQLRDGQLVESTSLEIHPSRPDTQAVRYWLEGVLATTKGVPTVPAEITARLGADSAAYALDRATLAALYAAHREVPTVQLKRELCQPAALRTGYPVHRRRRAVPRTHPARQHRRDHRSSGPRPGRRRPAAGHAAQRAAVRGRGHSRRRRG